MMAPRDHSAVPGPAARPSVMCCIEDDGARSRSALQHGAILARRRGDRGKSDRLIALVCACVPPFCMTEFAYDSVVIADGVSCSAPTAVTAMIQEVAELHRLTIEIHEISGWPSAAIVEAVRACDSDVVILPSLDHDAGRVARWLRRNLISGITTRTHAVVVDEYSSSVAPLGSS